MFISRWTFLQGLVLLALIGLAFAADLFKYDIAVPAVNPTQQLLLSLSFVIIVVGLVSLLFFFQTKKSDTFLVHRLWNKMHKVIIFILCLSVVIFIAAMNPISALIESYRFTFYLIIYYFIYLTNLLVLAFVHKNAKTTMPSGKKVSTAFWWTCLLFLLLQFMITSGI